jgi:hypothetical protein
MADNNKESLLLQVAKLSYPSDAVKLGTIRHEQPEGLTAAALSEFPFGQLAAGAMLHFEQILAARAFADAAGLPDPFQFSGKRGELISFLNDDYRRYGISTGTQMTKQLVRAFESTAASLGRQHCKAPPLRP